jgi:hypothetical protein
LSEGMTATAARASAMTPQATGTSRGRKVGPGTATQMLERRDDERPHA